MCDFLCHDNGVDSYRHCEIPDIGYVKKRDESGLARHVCLQHAKSLAYSTFETWRLVINEDADPCQIDELISHLGDAVPNRGIGLISIEGEHVQQVESETTSLVTFNANSDGDSQSSETRYTVGTGQESSVEITQNARGKARLCIKVYHADASVALSQAIELYEDGLVQLNRLGL